MKQKFKVLIVVAVIVFLTGSVFAYQKLSKQQNEAKDLFSESVITPEPFVTEKLETPLPPSSSLEDNDSLLSPAPTQTTTPAVTPTISPVVPQHSLGTVTPPKKQPATDFTVETLSGNHISLSDYFGKPIVVHFWTSSCGACKASMPDFQKVYNDLKNEVVFLMIDLVNGTKETKEKGSEYIKSKGYNFPVYYDVDQSAAKAYKVTSAPTTLFIDTNKDVVSIQKGAISKSRLNGEIEKIIGKNG